MRIEIKNLDTPMTFESAERAHEVQEREDYSALHDTDLERMMIEEQIITGYLSDAWEGSDDDWIVCDSNRTNESMAKILAIVRQRGAEPRDQINAIRSIILAMQAAGATEHLERMTC
jgi:hypothetical protein